MSGALEWGELSDAGSIGGDAQLGPAWSRAFLTATPAGFLHVITVYAMAALVDPGADAADRRAMRDVLEVTETGTYLLGADLEEGAEPFDSEYAYAWPVAFWPAGTLRKDGQPTARALESTARAHVRGLPLAWLESLPAPPAGYPIPSTAHPIRGLATS